MMEFSHNRHGLIQKVWVGISHITFSVSSPFKPLTTPSVASSSISAGHIRVIIASSLGTVFEWYDFFLYGSLAAIIAEHFFTPLASGAAFVMALFTFAAGFAVRPFGAIVFGRLGDMIGRKYTFLATIIIMGAATFLVGKYAWNTVEPPFQGSSFTRKAWTRLNCIKMRFQAFFRHTQHSDTPRLLSWCCCDAYKVWQ